MAVLPKQKQKHNPDEVVTNTDSDPILILSLRLIIKAFRFRSRKKFFNAAFWLIDLKSQFRAKRKKSVYCQTEVSPKSSIATISISSHFEKKLKTSGKFKVRVSVEKSFLAGWSSGSNGPLSTGSKQL